MRGLSSDNSQYVDSRYCDSGIPPPEQGTFAVIVRHAEPVWLRFLLQHQSRLSGVAFLMDDDIPGAWRCRDVPLRYSVLTSGGYLKMWPLLGKVCDRIWVSTRALQQRYARTPTRVVEPLSLGEKRTAAPTGTRRWAYHGTRIHRREIRWLLPVVEAVQQASPDHAFEIFGSARVVQLFAHIPRVQVLQPRSWPDYLAHCRSSNLALGVAPLLPGRYNAVRSYVKLFDITRCGATGVFSRREPYAPALEAAGASLVGNDPQLWIAEILRLLNDDAIRVEKYHQACRWINAHQVDGDLGALIRDNPSSI